MTRVIRILNMNPVTHGNGLAWRAPLALLLASGIVAIACVTSLTNEATAQSTEPALQDRGQDGNKSAGARSRGFPDEEALMQRLKRGVEEGRVTREQMGQIMATYKRLAMGIESGRMSSKEANAMFEECVSMIMRGGKGTRGESAPEGDEKAIARSMGAIMIQLGKELRSGKTTPEQALKRLMKAAKHFQIDGAEKTPAAKRMNRADYAEAQKKMAAMVEKGEITREQMTQRLDRMRRMMAE